MSKQNPLLQLSEYGQAIWLDFLSRDFVDDGSLAKLVTEDGLTGLTSNPTIFAAAIEKGGSYDDALARLESAMAGAEPAQLYEKLAVADIQAAADVFKPVHLKSAGADGFVSLEVAPAFADDTGGTVAEARRLWKSVGRDNLMIKVPGTQAGLPAIAQLLGEGINVNITLLFSQEVYEQVVDAYFEGLETYAKQGGDLRRLASVASFFVSRIDAAVEKAGAPEALHGKVAIANARQAYRRFRHRFVGPRWEALADKGARPQRLLWASTGTKNKAFSDVLYVEELIGRDTVNTLPPATMNAFRDHGRVRASLEENLAAADQVMAELKGAGISIEEITDNLVKDGLKAFAESMDKILEAVAHKRPGADAKVGGGRR